MAAQLDVAAVPPQVWIRVRGIATLAVGPALRACLECIDSADVAEIRLDLSGCERIDSTFAGCLVGYHQRSRSEQRPPLVVQGPHPQCAAVFRQMRLDQILTIDPDPCPDLPWRPVDVTGADRDSMARTIIEAHENLAASHPDNAGFGRIAAALRADYEKRTPR